MFENIQIPADALPRVGDIDWQPMDPGLSRQQVLIGAIVFALMVAGFGGVVTSLTPDQAKYIGVDQEGPYKPESYKY